jgi:hypothetical protein
VAVNLDITSQFSFGDGEGLKPFFLAHRLEHQSNAQLIVAQFGVAVPGFDVSDEVARQEWQVLMARLEGGPKSTSKHLKDWLTLHDMIHKAEYNAIGFGLAPDLLTVNFAVRGQFNQWMLDHQQAHDAVGSALGSTT